MSGSTQISAFERRLVQGAEELGLTLSPAQVRLLETHARELMAWNRKMNLTAIRSPEAIAEKHFIDALAVSRFITREKKIMDMGTGGGFPSLPLKIIHPGIAFTLVDAVRKKVTFLNHVIRTLGLDGIRADHARVEELALTEGVAGTFDAVISRGFAQLDVFVALALPMLRPGGVIWAMKGEDGTSEITPDLAGRFRIRTDDYRLPFEKSGRVLIRLSPL